MNQQHPTPEMTHIPVQEIIRLARQAGAEILKIYNTAFEVEEKVDTSPLTQADLASNATIVAGLSQITPDIPVLSEEMAEIPFEERSAWDTFWCVDPLDGTKEFIKRTGEFTVNIGLIESGIPTFGVVYAPVTGIMFVGGTHPDAGFARRIVGQTTDEIHVRALNPDKIDIVASRDHAGPKVKELANRYPNAGFKSMGSSLKFCLVAMGEADVYLRDVPTMEWDTAAAHAVLRAAGGEIYTMDGISLSYNKISLRNPEIVALGSEFKLWGIGSRE